MTETKTALEIGMGLGYMHLVPFLEQRGTCHLREVYDHLARIGITEAVFPPSAIADSAWWREFRSGVGRLNPIVWTSVQRAKYGPALPLLIGDPLPRAHWGLRPSHTWTGTTHERDGYGQIDEAATVYARLFDQFAGMKFAGEGMLPGKPGRQPLQLRRRCRALLRRLRQIMKTELA